MIGQVLGIQGLFHLEHWRDGVLRQALDFKNKITKAGKIDLLDQYFDLGVGKDWYVGLLKSSFTDYNNNTPTIAADIFGSYDELTRSYLNFELAAEGSGGDAGYVIKYNSTANYCIFTISNGVVNQGLNGVFVCDTDTGAYTVLWCTAAFGNNDGSPQTITVNAGDILKVQYKVRIAL